MTCSADGIVVGRIMKAAAAPEGTHAGLRASRVVCEEFKSY